MKRTAAFLLVPALTLLSGVAGAQGRGSAAPARSGSASSHGPARSTSSSRVSTGARVAHVPPTPTSHLGVSPLFRGRYAFRPFARVGAGIWAGYPIVYPYTAAPSVPVDQALADGADTISAPPFNALPADAEGLHLDVQPATAQVFVDGLYVGTVEDFDALGGPLAPGPHQVELRAAGYDSISLPVAIAAGHVTSYSDTMVRVRGATSPARDAGTIYVIPGCYLGNVAPRADALPPGCDVQQVRTLEPAPGTR